MKKGFNDTVISVLALLIVIFTSVLLRAQVLESNGAGNITIEGRYWYIFSNGAPPETNEYSFVVAIAPNGWTISATNAAQTREWGMMQYDGTNIYTMGADSLNGYDLYGYVYPGRFFIPEAEETTHLFFPWMAFFLTPEMIQSRERNSSIDSPSPWGKRFSLADYGFKWDTSFFEGGKIIRQINAVREPSLDLKSDEDEFRRPSINYAFEYSSLEHRKETLQMRKGVPEGFVRATFECQSLYRTNNITLPGAVTFVEYWPNFRNPQGPVRLVFKMALTVEHIDISKAHPIASADSPGTITVYDYRYQATNNRTKFNYATYTLEHGKAIPSAEDPKLKAQADAWLRNGPGYNNLEPKRKTILVGMLIITLTMGALLVFWLSRVQINNKS